jgi:hypothetical protein
MYENLDGAHRGGLRNSCLLYPPHASSAGDGLIETIIAILPIETKQLLPHHIISQLGTPLCYLFVDLFQFWVVYMITCPCDARFFRSKDSLNICQFTLDYSPVYGSCKYATNIAPPLFNLCPFLHSNSLMCYLKTFRVAKIIQCW